MAMGSDIDSNNRARRTVLRYGTPYEVSVSAINPIKLYSQGGLNLKVPCSFLALFGAQSPKQRALIGRQSRCCDVRRDKSGCSASAQPQQLQTGELFEIILISQLGNNNSFSNIRRWWVRKQRKIINNIT